MTQTAAVIGTAQYLSPEQARASRSTRAATSTPPAACSTSCSPAGPPFIGDSPVAVAYQHVREEPAPPSHLDPEITPERDAIVLKALAKDPDYRYQTADEMRADIQRAQQGMPVSAPTMAMNAGTQVMGGTGQHTQATRPATMGYDLRRRATPSPTSRRGAAVRSRSGASSACSPSARSSRCT